MLRFRLLFWLFLLAGGIAPLRGQAQLLPLALDDPDGHWRLIPAARTLPDGLELAAFIVPRVGRPIRMMIFRVPATPGVADPLAAFAERLRRAVVLEPVADLHGADARRIGYAGHLLSLNVPRSDGVSACEIFTFAAGTDYWGILQITPPDLHDEPPFAALKKAAPVAAGAVALAPFQVHEDPVTSFPIALRVQRQVDRDRIGRIVVTEVPAGSSTEREGVKVGDEVIRIEGRAVTEFGGGLSRRSDLGKLLLDRRPGSTVELEIISPGDPRPRKVTLTAGPDFDPFRRR